MTFGAALAFAVVATSSFTLHLAAPSESERLREEIVSAHVRSLMASHLADVASSDQHTVKPWFDGKLDFSPPVVDLTAEGFPLVGGRLDYLNNRPVAALAYRHRQHSINLFVWPANGKQGGPTETASKQGYHLLRWTHAGMVYSAVSDLNPAELTRFKDLVSAHGAQ